MKQKIKMKLKSVLWLVIFLSTLHSAKGNNVQVLNATRTGANLDEVEFELSWENSWDVTGAPANHDAVWIFIKFRECGMTSNEWSHALLSTTMTDHSFGADITYATPILQTDRFGNGTGHNTGVMVKRATTGIGDITSQTVRLKIVGSSNAVALDPSTEYDIKVFGVEMVYVPEGQFYAGDGVSSNTIREYNSNPYQPVLFTSEDPVQIHEYYSLTVPAEFPKGYSAFYIMKYEITHGQYVDFLNTINSSMQTNRAYIYDYYRHDIQHDGTEYYTNSVDRPLVYMSFEDLLAYLDWSALRPLSELEYEKACRGPLDFVPDELAFGTGNSSDITECETITGATPGVEVTTDNSNCHIYITQYTISGGQFDTGGGSYANQGPVAAGIFARGPNFTRIGTGATYYGVMEMSGNVYEQCIQVNTSNSNNSPSAYDGIWGDGQLLSSGIYDVVNWPTSGYYIYRGGSYRNNQDRARVSDRYYRARSSYTSRAQDQGGRGCR